MNQFENEMFAAIEILLEEKILAGISDIKRRLTIIESQIFNLSPHYSGVDIFFHGDNGLIMADLVLAQGESKVAVLHYTTAGVDSGAVPAGDNPQFVVDDPTHLATSPNPDGSVTITNTNSGNGDVDVKLTGSAKGFSKDKVVTCSGISAPPPPQPDGVDIVFQ
jgi:hypothetical protein